MATQPKNNHVMFVCSNPQVTELLLRLLRGGPGAVKQFLHRGLRGNP